ncbi:MAG: DUF393 domain-containing protein [Candidatus Marinimicrobia bacterium]|nr:DUF393 domain-containing protein [Candidatus Neomarinimicrobiota bacterium]MCF7839350.1 DUF393 domain-containing protein [Candidatus Neomarinimicrobiota bacterium]MCF7901953.1 DUF393 domain-containing protein [Candidatus Neomarinimicrobiota bacterium]
MAVPQFHRAVIDRATQYLIYLVIAGGLLYSINRWFILPAVDADSFFRTSLHDVLALIVFVPLSYFLARRLSIISPNIPLRLWHIGLGWLVFSVVFEWLVPNVMPHRTGTWGDVGAYALGGLLLWAFNGMALDLALIREADLQIVYYDGNCGICQAAADWSSARTVSEDPFPYKPHLLLDESADPELAARARKTLIVHFAEGLELTHARALGALLIRMKQPWPLVGWLLISPIFWPLARPVYSIFAHYRHKISQWFGLNACAID